MLFDLDTVKKHSRITGDFEDSTIMLILRSSIEHIQAYTGHYLGEQKRYEEALTFDNYGISYLQYRPVGGKVTIQEWAKRSFEAPVIRTRLEVKSFAKPPVGSLFGFSQGRRCDCDEDQVITATAFYEVGFDCLDEIPPDIYHAVLKLVSWHFEKRGDEAVAKYTRKGGGLSSLFDNRGFEFSGAAELVAKYRHIEFI